MLNLICLPTSSNKFMGKSNHLKRNTLFPKKYINTKRSKKERKIKTRNISVCLSVICFFLFILSFEICLRRKGNSWHAFKVIFITYLWYLYRIYLFAVIYWQFDGKTFTFSQNTNNVTQIHTSMRIFMTVICCCAEVHWNGGIWKIVHKRNWRKWRKGVGIM